MTLVCFYSFPADVSFAQPRRDTFDEPSKLVVLYTLVLCMDLYFLTAVQCSGSPCTSHLGHVHSAFRWFNLLSVSWFATHCLHFFANRVHIRMDQSSLVTQR